MPLVGFSTGALALGDFEAALDMLKGLKTRAIELSALRDHEIGPLMEALPGLDLSEYEYVSVHVPSSFKSLTETEVSKKLLPCIDLDIAIVIHPDVIDDAACWEPFGSLLCIENMDKRKSTGRTAEELERFFTIFPSATFCLDIAHARQVDCTMTDARLMLRRFGDRLRQLHISELDGQGHHHGLSLTSILATGSVAALIDENIPAIIEAQIAPEAITLEINAVENALAHHRLDEMDWERVDWGAQV